MAQPRSSGIWFDALSFSLPIYIGNVKIAADQTWAPTGILDKDVLRCARFRLVARKINYLMKSWLVLGFGPRPLHNSHPPSTLQVHYL